MKFVSTEVPSKKQYRENFLNLTILTIKLRITHKLEDIPYYKSQIENLTQQNNEYSKNTISICLETNKSTLLQNNLDYVVG